ncbi:MAG: Ig-like domain-containing protein [Holophagales bacterium]|nr:Ig-like domain-containing protein [Holophagales bacterium]
MLLSFGAAEALAVDFGTTEVGQPVDRYIQFTNGNQDTTYLWSAAAPGFVIFEVPSFTIPKWSTFTIGVRMTATSAGTFSGPINVLLTSGAGYADTLRDVVTPPCPTPSVSVTAPADGATASPNGAGNIIFEATASDSTGISRVDFLVDGAVVASDHVAPYAYAWPAKEGSHCLTARAVNTCGKTRTQTTSFTVDCGPLSVAITSPTQGATVSPNAAGNVILQATASHPTGIQKLNFFVDGIFQQTDISPPYAWAWPAVSGAHVIAVRATSICGNAQNAPTGTWINVVP